jgi:GT2 family glycosyltransferase
LERTLPPTKLVKTNRNLGFTGGNYVGYKHKAKDSKYIVTISNDFVVEQSSLMSLIKFLEEHNDVAGVQGKITTWGGDKIDNCGFYFDSMYRVYARYYGYPSTKDVEQAEISFVSGCYSAYKVEAIKKCGGLFGSILPYFGYFDNADTCLRLWRMGYKIRYVPILAGRHKSGASFSSPLKNYLNGRNRVSSILNLAGIRRFISVTWIIYFLSRIALYSWLGLLRDGERKMRGKHAVLILVNGFSLARRTPKIGGEPLEPRVKLRFSTMVKMMVFPTYIEPTVSALINNSETYKIEG